MRPEAAVAFVVLCAVGLPWHAPARSAHGATRPPDDRLLANVRRRAGALSARRGLGNRRRRAVPLVLELLARELRSGVTIAQAFRNVAPAADPALDLDLMVQRLGQGAGLTAAVDWWVTRLDRSDAAVVAGVFHLGAETGTAVADALDRAASGIRARGELSDEVRALTAQSRASAVLVGLAPLAFAAVLAAAEPASLTFLFGSPLGIGCLLVGLVLDAVGFWWMHRLVIRVVP